jgi:hypothetical protein
MRDKITAKTALSRIFDGGRPITGRAFIYALIRVIFHSEQLATLTGLSLLAQGSTKVAFGLGSALARRVVEPRFECPSDSPLATLTGFEPVLPP